ncbi:MULTISPECIES: flagellar biosynthesis protein FlgN [Bradyrhizobium]|uniref:flagellar biosynthesis protein FlgN n=1 Tax=Bradyrhizobium TaxID=374 RepID=UPI00155F45EE|nr:MULTISPECIES: flagellar biosynthesis protein FlgN [Bradyrhizobium]MDD1520152.1 flagellar biosynthesis protein FlgN [Bradyrhizobium sp. WBAH30]MDD1544396.1 flagellar biosynthesis protein FlgN [Bradyrhizobium sp. WBAH41]MDD1558278.1 flagellar biosynthesis protein FlgN [Bradyrhizobium sp. WBAH23]MDD1565676.1 flagellar biosynthesis protein FlgN [Bradyrhizobium sp. WBAH33]MDD1590806.1 flagellar biosynthesis protein FlgN [Bradyrhizobium sp. WBAH42]
MQAHEGAVAVAMDQAVADTEMMTTEAALLPVLLPIGGGEAMVDAADAVRSDEMRGLLAAIRRLASIVEEETTALATGQKIDFDDFSARKSRSMLEFVRLMRARMHLGGQVEITEEIQRLREKLERNRSILEMHYDAVREVASIIVKAVKDAESDGTYTGRTAQDGK